MDTARWPQEIVVKPMEEIVPNACSKQPSLERRVRPQKEQALNCPRCNSTNTKFCYYNNYSLSQPRYFCKSCRRYWTEGGSLRNIPLGGSSRKNKRSSSSSISSSSSKKQLPDLVLPTTNTTTTATSQNPKFYEGQDLNLGFPSHDFKTISELIQVPNFDNNNSSKKTHMQFLPSSSSSEAASSSSHHLSAMELLTGISASRGFNSFMPMPGSDPNPIFSSGFSLPELKPSLSFSLDGIGSGSGYGSLHDGVQETSAGKLLFPFEDLKQVSTTSSDIEQQNREQGDPTGYWNGVLGGGSW